MCEYVYNGEKVIIENDIIPVDEEFLRKNMVFCKDCEYYNHESKLCNKFEPFFKKDNHLYSSGHGFCAFGRKKEDKE